MLGLVCVISLETKRSLRHYVGLGLGVLVLVTYVTYMDHQYQHDFEDQPVTKRYFVVTGVGLRSKQDINRVYAYKANWPFPSEVYHHMLIETQDGYYALVVNFENYAVGDRILVTFRYSKDTDDKRVHVLSTEKKTSTKGAVDV